MRAVLAGKKRGDTAERSILILALDLVREHFKNLKDFKDLIEF